MASTDNDKLLCRKECTVYIRDTWVGGVTGGGGSFSTSSPPLDSEEEDDGEDEPDFERMLSRLLTSETITGMATGIGIAISGGGG